MMRNAAGPRRMSLPSLIGSFHTCNKSDRTSPARRFFTPRGLPFLPIVLPGLNIQFVFLLGHKVGAAEAVTEAFGIDDPSQAPLRDRAAFPFLPLLDNGLALARNS